MPKQTGGFPFEKPPVCHLPGETAPFSAPPGSARGEKYSVDGFISYPITSVLLIRSVTTWLRTVIFR